MAELQIKTRSAQKRCEICHQSDCYDPVANYCSRCAGIDSLSINIKGNPNLLPAFNRLVDKHLMDGIFHPDLETKAFRIGLALNSLCLVIIIRIINFLFFPPREESLLPLAVIILGFISFLIWLPPLMLWFTQKINIEPEFKCINPDDTPDRIVFLLLNNSRRLVTQGFIACETFSEFNCTRKKIVGYTTLLRHPVTGDIAEVTVSTTKGVHNDFNCNFGFYTKLNNGKYIITYASKSALPFFYKSDKPRMDVTIFHKFCPPEELYQIHLGNTKSYPITGRAITPSGSEKDFLLKLWSTSLEILSDQKRVYQVEPGLYRYTFKGSYLIGWTAYLLTYKSMSSRPDDNKYRPQAPKS